MIGLGALYRGFAIGAMGIVAPISAASPVVPLAVDAAQRRRALDRCSGSGWRSSSPASSSSPGSRAATGQRRVAAGAGLAVVAALGFGLFFVGIDAGADESAAWAVTAARARRGSGRRRRRPRDVDDPQAASRGPPADRRCRRLRHRRKRPRSRRQRPSEPSASSRCSAACIRSSRSCLRGSCSASGWARAKRVGGVVALAGAALVAAGFRRAARVAAVPTGITSIADESLLRPLAAVLVVLASLWFAALATSRVDRSPQP